MGLYKKLDLWSVSNEIDKIADTYFNRNSFYGGKENDSQYWDYYSEQINEMGILASDLQIELDRLTNKIGYELPYKNIDFCGEDDCTKTGIAWFNTAACMLSDTDMTELLENENIYGLDDNEILREKQKRFNALNKLNKKQLIFLYTEVIGFITRYLELQNAFETITAVIRELEHHQSFTINTNGKVESCKEAYL